MNQRHLRILHGWSFVLLLYFTRGLISLHFTIGLISLYFTISLIFFCFVMELVSFVSVSLLLIAHLREWHTDTHWHRDTETQSQSHSNTVLNEYCTSNCNTHTLHTSNLFDKPFILVLFSPSLFLVRLFVSQFISFFSGRTHLLRCSFILLATYISHTRTHNNTKNLIRFYRLSFG